MEEIKGAFVGGATFGYTSRQAGSGVPGPGGVMSCSEVMYQYYPYLYQRPPPPPTHPHAAPHPHSHGNPHAAHHSPARPAPFQPFSATAATHQYDRVSLYFIYLFLVFTIAVQRVDLCVLVEGLIIFYILLFKTIGLHSRD